MGAQNKVIAGDYEKGLVSAFMGVISITSYRWII